MEITRLDDLAHWPMEFEVTTGWPYSKLIRGPYYSPHGIVDVRSWECDVDAAFGSEETPSPLRQLLVVDRGGIAGYTQLRMVLAGQGWGYEESRYYPPVELALLLSNFIGQVLRTLTQARSYQGGN